MLSIKYPGETWFLIGLTLANYIVKIVLNTIAYRVMNPDLPTPE